MKKAMAVASKSCDLNECMGRISCVQGPCILGPGPPNEPKDEYCLSYHQQTEIMMQQTNNLGYRKNENEVKKQFNESHALTFRVK